jgi:hypothetical protein
MSLMLNKDQSFSMSAYVTSPGPQTIALSGYLVEKRNGETWVAPLIPQLFYGVDGQQLGPSWRQNFTQTGEQVILSRVAGHPDVPHEELYWRKVSDMEVGRLGAAAPSGEIPWSLIVTGATIIGFIGLIAYLALRDDQ